ncbi:MAG TPA: ribonuclease Z [Actinocrinis sp.]|nr:ribonuclease Z [Actinocrinis sp.]
MRELVILGTASQVPTRERNHNGYFLRWDEHGLLFDPGDGIQRQMVHMGIAASDITRICVTHFHGDHCFGLPGVISRLALDDVQHPVHCHYPASGKDLFDRLRWTRDEFAERVLREEPAEGPRTLLAQDATMRLEAVRLDHGVESHGYRLTEPDGRRMLPDRLAAAGLRGPAISEVQRLGQIEVDGRTVTLAEVSEHRPGQVFAFVMDTRLCDGVYELAQGTDMLVIESTFLDEDRKPAADYGHMTARQAAEVAAAAGVRTLVLTHFSQRYPEPDRFEREAREVFEGELVVAADLTRVAVPERRVVGERA